MLVSTVNEKLKSYVKYLNHQLGQSVRPARYVERDEELVGVTFADEIQGHMLQESPLDEAS